MRLVFPDGTTATAELYEDDGTPIRTPVRCIQFEADAAARPQVVRLVVTYDQPRLELEAPDAVVVARCPRCGAEHQCGDEDAG